ncbi:hypothetical protein FQR65_LT17644 [Abscondita terminalis]|nr:hypothetical protein FQR65_LT17644 [Abscondita terminalis]
MSQTNNNSLPNSTVTRDLRQLDKGTDNLYESIVVISKRANQVAVDMKEELNGKLAEFASNNDNLEEVFENREQIEISKHYEQTHLKNKNNLILMSLQGKNIVIGVCGSIAAYKIATLVRLLVKEKAAVQIIMTPDAVEFITPLTLSTLSNKPVLVDYFDKKTGSWNNHVHLGPGSRTFY